MRRTLLHPHFPKKWLQNYRVLLCPEFQRNELICTLDAKIQHISILSVLSGHVSKNIELRSAHESYLSGKSDSFLMIEGELSQLDGNFICEDEPRSLILRARLCEQMEGSRKSILTEYTSWKATTIFAIIFTQRYCCQY